jgi:hypothetical protein
VPEIGCVVDIVVDQHRFDADPVPNFHDAVPDRDPDRHQNSADPHAEFCSCWIISLYLVTALPVYNVLSFLTVSLSNVLSISVLLTQYGNFRGKKFTFYLELIPVRIRQNGADPIRSTARLQILIIF